MKKIPMLERFAAQSLVESDGELVFSKEKFAELIVRECIDIVKPTQHHEAWAQSYLGGVDGLELLDSRVEKIKQHFGVEE